LLAAGVRLALPARLLLVLAALLVLHAGVAANATEWRPLAFGMPAFLLVAAAALGPVPATIPGSARGLVLLGDASYAMYLVHPFIMRGLSITWHKIHAHGELGGTIYVLAGLAVAQCCALAINLTLERKLNRLLRRRSGRQDEIIQMPGMRTDGIL
jgi:peptidoglycan/LPS O-acetylase OafA/YrhL